MAFAALNRLLRKSGLGPASKGSLPQHRALQAAFDIAARRINPRFRFALIEDGGINGVAVTGWLHSYIGITTGSVILLESLYSLLVRSEHLFLQHEEGGSQTGIAEHVIATFRVCVDGFDRVELPESYFDFLRIEAQNSARQDLAYAFYHRSLRFLFYHELAHLARGHGKLVYAGENRRVVSLFEAAGNECCGDIANKRAQWAELEADWLAAVWLMQRESWRTTAEDREETFFEIFFAFGVVLLVFFRALRGNSKSHPHPYVRLAQVLNNAPGYLRNSELFGFKDVKFAERGCERVIAEIALTAKLGGFEWFAEMQDHLAGLSHTVGRLNQAAGPDWEPRAQARMKRVILRSPS